MKLKDKIILVTGGSKGIGKGIAKIFLDEGAKVTICSRSKEELENTVDELEYGSQISSLRADLIDMKCN